MSINRTTAAVLLFAASIPAFAAAPFAATPACEDAFRETLYSLAIPLDSNAFSESPAKSTAALLTDAVAAATPAGEAVPSRELLATFAMTLRDIRYRRGGRAPTTGFDCSGFVQYVFAKALGIDLPNNSASQFSFGEGVTRSQLQTGDLVFFHTRGKRVSHVGIYLDNGRFIHSPSTGKRVRVDELGDRYWAKRYMGARRPTTLSS